MGKFVVLCGNNKREAAMERNEENSENPGDGFDAVRARLGDAEVELAQLKQKIEEAHAQLDVLDVPRYTPESTILTVAGRLEWLREHGGV